MERPNEVPYLLTEANAFTGILIAPDWKLRPIPTTKLVEK
jgi:hypothetical protein